jgi:hypothetical protein
MKFGTNIDLCYKEIQFARVHNVTADVDNPLVGQFFYRADTGDFVFFGKHGRQVFVDHNYFANTYIPWLNLNFSLATHNHNLNDLTEKSYNSLSDLPSLNFEPANANIQSHIGDGNIHVTTIKTAAWDAKLDVSTSIPSLDTIDKRLTPAINEVNAIAKGAGNGETVTDIAALVTLLNNALPTDYPYGKNFYLVDTEVPDFWISVVSSTSVPYTYVDDTTFLDDIAVTGILQIGYYSVSELEGQKVDLTDYYDKSAADLLLGAKEDITNKSSNVDTDKASTTKYPHVKAIYDWAVGKFIDLAKIVTTWTATTLDTNIPSEKLVKDSLNLKADITPANGSTSALRALFIARGYYKATNTYYCVYNANTGYYEMNGLTDLTEAQMADIYINTAVQINIGIGAVTSFTCMSYSNIRTSFPRTSASGYDDTNDINRFRYCNKLEVYKNYEFYGHLSYSCTNMFNGCSELHTVDFINLLSISNAAYVADCFTGCVKLVTANVKTLKVAFSFKDCPLLSLASLQYLVTNRANGTSRITITVHATVWGYLNDAVGHPTWNALLVDAVNNQYIDFASA